MLREPWQKLARRLIRYLIPKPKGYKKLKRTRYEAEENEKDEETKAEEDEAKEDEPPRKEKSQR